MCVVCAVSRGADGALTALLLLRRSRVQLYVLVSAFCSKRHSPVTILYTPARQCGSRASQKSHEYSSSSQAHIVRFERGSTLSKEGVEHLGETTEQKAKHVRTRGEVAGKQAPRDESDGDDLDQITDEEREDQREKERPRGRLVPAGLQEEHKSGHMCLLC